MTLTNARAKVRRFLDDTDVNPLVSDADIDDSLATAQYEVQQLLVSSGGNLLTQEASITSSATGSVSLAAIAPLKVVYVQFTIGTQRYQVPPSRSTDWVQTVTAPQTLIIGYVPRPIFPASGAATFTWSGTVDSPVLDKYMVAIAACESWIESGEAPLATLEQRRDQLKRTVLETINVPGWTVMPIASAKRYPHGRNAGFQWVMTARDAMQLVYA